MLSVAAGLIEEVEVFPLLAEGTEVGPGTRVMEISGPARAVLAGERSALNALMVLSGIATTARRWQAEAGERLQVLDTRKTLPGLRALSKYAVRVGGAVNHRFGLYDMVLVKDNHVKFAGGITAAVQAARRAAPGLAVEVETDTIEQAIEAATAGADIVLLDNMDDAMMRAAISGVRDAAEIAGHVVLTEASGSVRFDRLAALRDTGVDRVSSSALSLAPPLDLALDELAG
jgi:nicotinate-nucleotide pyrophosphorylase (carboxylating)